MKRARPRDAGKQPKKNGSVPGEAARAVDLDRVYEQIRRLVGNRAVNMVESLLADADQGHFQAMKCLFEMVGLCPAAGPEAKVEEDSLAKILLRRLKLSAEPAGTEVTQERARDKVQPASNAVE